MASPRAIAALSVDPSGIDEDTLSPSDLFCSLSSLRYDATDAPPRRQAAADLLAADPKLVQGHVWAAASAADQAALAQQLNAQPGLATAHGGPFSWVPLMYLCYGRTPLDRSQDETLAAATLLLDAGADPDSGYLWRGMLPPFTALTGVFGEGEQGPRRQPPHPFSVALATLLLQRGAHPVDQQTLYNRMFRPDDSHLELLFTHGLADAGPSHWELLLGASMETREQMWQRQVDWAAEHGFTDRLQLLARHDIDISGGNTSAVRPSPAHISNDPTTRDDRGATALHHAAWDGDIARIQRLLDAGADPMVTDLQFGATPLGWAEHAYQTEAADLLRPHTIGGG